MLVLTLGQTDQKLYVTLNEKRTLDSGYYLFVFTHNTTRTVVNKIFNFSEDESSYTDRYNRFPVNTSVLFANQDPGLWSYNIYEQASSSNTDVTGLTEVERGFLKLNRAVDFEMEEYNPSTTYKQYGG